jgi:hypothetical protein
MNKTLKTFLILFTIILTTKQIDAQDNKETKPEWIQFHGFANYELIYDTRQSQAVREGEVYLYPKPFEADQNGNDINDHGKLHMFSFHSRLKAQILEVEMGKIKTSGAIEFDFLGTNDGTVNLIRLRHAYLKVSMPKFEWLAGQYWHPMFVPECYPEVISWGAAAPIHVLCRVPQLRLTYLPSSKISLLGSISSQRDFTSSGPNGNSSEYIKNAKVPEMQFQLMLKPTSTIIAGFTAGYKVIAPRIVTDSAYSCNETLSSYNFNAFARYKGEKFDFKIGAIYGQNLSSLLLIGGYAVKSITDSALNIKEYVNLHTGSLWTDISLKIKDFSLGLFLGYSKNYGTNSFIDNISSVYGLGTNIKYIYNISPRVVYNVNKLKLALELNNTAAAFGNYTNYLEIMNEKLEANYRFIFSASLSF